MHPASCAPSNASRIPSWATRPMSDAEWGQRSASCSASSAWRASPDRIATRKYLCCVSLLLQKEHHHAERQSRGDRCDGPDPNPFRPRLMSYAILRRALGTPGLWSVARGLARQETAYKEHLADCDGARRGDRDGCGTLSEAALASFTSFFLRTCIDQVEFMESLMRSDRLRDRILIWTEEEIRAGTLPPEIRCRAEGRSLSRADRAR